VRSILVGFGVLVVLAVAGFVGLRFIAPSSPNGPTVTLTPSPSDLGTPNVGASAAATDGTTPSASDLESGASPGDTATPQPTPTPTASPTPPPDSLVTARPLPTPIPAETGPINYLSSSRGAVVRAWTPLASHGYPNTPVDGASWTPPTTLGPPYLFVFELPALTSLTSISAAGTISSTAPTANPSGSLATSAPTASVAVAVSTQSSSAGFSDAGTLPFGVEASAPPTLTFASPLQARWIRMTLQAPPGSRLSFEQVGAFGTQAPLAPSKLDGFWYEADLGETSPFIDMKGGRLRERPDAAALLKAGETAFGAITRDAAGQFARCGGGDATSVFATADDGSHRLATRGGTDPSKDGTLVSTPDGSMLVFNNGTYPAHLYYRAATIPHDCVPTLQASGHGTKRVGIFTRQSDYNSSYVPAAMPSAFPGYRFVPYFAPLMKPSDLTGLDTIVFGSACDIGRELQPWQTQPIVDFVSAGHKLIIHDADTCRPANYSFLPNPLALSAAGAQGAKGDRLLLIENDGLGTDASDRRHYVDLNSFVKNLYQQIGDGDLIISDDPSWCGHLLSTNAVGASGYVQAYSHLGKGLIIYDGLDHDNYNVPEYLQLIRYELELPLNANLPCAHAVGGFTIVPERTTHDYVPGKAQQIGVDLQALAIMTYSGTIGLQVAGPYPASLSPSSMTLKQNVAPFGLVVAVPKDARGPHQFTITGTDTTGKRSVATVILKPGKISALERTLGESGRITLHNILFDTASAKLRPASYAVLSQIADALGRNRGWRLSIQGHTDSDGGAAYNLDLSQRRAASVKTALVTNFHVDPKRLQTQGFGLTRPVASNATDAGKQLNRRVELVRI
jgi:outer membrane protein OmpA-like peptidoglycan-associated protein